MAVVPDVVEFLRQYAPFSEFDPEAVEVLAGAVEIEFHVEGQIIFSQGQEPLEFLRVIRAGSVEVVDDGHVLDVMGPGEMFGHASMLSGLPTGFQARAAEDTLTYRIGADVAERVLALPRGLRYLSRVWLEDRHHLRAGLSPGVVRDQLRQPVRSAVRAAPLIVTPDTSVREAARQMTEHDVTACLVNVGNVIGIVTDVDLRSKVLAGGLSAETPVSAVMSSPAISVPGERPGSEVLLDMLDRGMRHMPVTSSTGHLIGIVEDHDLIAFESRASFSLRQVIAGAQNFSELVAASKNLRPAVINMTRGGMDALTVMSIFSVVADALTRRALDLTIASVGDAPARFAWLALGSQARREALPSSDVDSAIASFDGGEQQHPDPHLGEVATAVTSLLEQCGFALDDHRVSAADPLFVRSLSSWRREAFSLIDDPTQPKALIIVSVLVDSRSVWGLEGEPLIAELFRRASARPVLLRLLARFALSHRPPSGFSRGLVVDSSGEHRNRLDLKSGAVVPITDLARWAGMSAGVACASTVSRIQAARDSDVLSGADAQSLQDAFEFVCQLRLDHQVAQLEQGHAADNLVDPNELSPLTRSYLKETFRAIASIQRRIAHEVQMTG